MAGMTFMTGSIGFQEYQPDQEDLCSLCGGNFGKAAMVGCKDRIHVCMECVDLLGVIKKERDDKKRDEAISSIKEMLMYDYGDDPRLNDAVTLYEAIAAGKIPHIRID